MFEGADGRQIHFKHGFSAANGTAWRNMIGTTVLVAYDPANPNDNIVGTSKSLVFPIGLFGPPLENTDSVRMTVHGFNEGGLKEISLEVLA